MTQNPPISTSQLTRTISSDPHRLAKHAIRVLEQRIYADFGLKLRMGAELEFALAQGGKTNLQEAVLSIEGPNYDDNRPLDLHGHLPAKHRPADRGGFFSAGGQRTFDCQRLDNLRDPLFPDSPIIAYSYNEANPNQLEAVISHRARHDTLPADGSRALGFARSIAATKHTIETSANNPNRRFAQEPTHQAALKMVSHNWQPTFKACANGHFGPQTHGMHINISFIDAKNHPLPSSFYTTKAPNNAHPLKDGLMPCLKEGEYLMCSEPSFFQRALDRKSIGSVYPANKPSPDKYVEITVPAASSDPYYTTLVVLASVHEMLTLGKFNRATHVFDALDAFTSTNVSIPSIPTGDHAEKEYADRFFNGERRILKLLNGLEPQLGDRFEETLRAHPPMQPLSIPNQTVGVHR